MRSAMPSSTAARLCPDAIWTEGHYDRYREMSNEVMSILWDETPHVQQVSIDEAFMDVTPNEVNREHPVMVARRIQRRVEELGVTCSIGVGTTKAVAKLASDMDKPRGLTVVLPGSEENFFDPQPLRALSGIGPSAERVLKEHGISTLGELARADDASIVAWLGKSGRVMLDRVRCAEDDPIEPDTDVKSVSNEVSFANDMTDREDIMAAICTMAAKTGRRLRRKGLKGKTIALKIRYDDRTVRSVQRPIGMPSDDEFLFETMLDDMLSDLWSPGMSVRLVGVAVTGFGEAASNDGQLSLFDAQPEQNGLMSDERRRGIMTATDKVKERFGESALRFGRELRLGGNTTGSSSKNPADYK